MFHISRITSNLFVLSSILIGVGFSLYGDHVESAALGRSRRKTESERGIRFRNQSGRKVELMWVNVFKEPNAFVSQSLDGEGYLYGADTTISSFIGHTFEIQELPGRKTGSCINNECRKVRFTVNDQENQEVTVERDFSLTVMDDRLLAVLSAKDMFEKCKSTTDGLSLVESIDAIASCMEGRTNTTLAEQEEERKFQSSLRERMAHDLVPYACGAVNYTETMEMNNLTWRYKDDVDTLHKKYDLQMMHDRPTSQIFVVDNFTTSQYCDAMKIYVQDNKIPVLSISEKTVQGTRLFQLVTKIYELAKVALSWDGHETHQMILDAHQMGYPLFDVLKDDVGVDVPTRLCIGEETEESSKCQYSGSPPHIATTKRITVENPAQMANVFLFCDEPETLGALHFPYAHIHVKPEVGRLVMAINRRNREDTELDGYVGEYHLCPNHNVYMHTFADITRN
jgi:hypothetical protein